MMVMIRGDELVWRLVITAIWLLPCAWSDWRTREVPNALTISAFLVAWPIALWRGLPALAVTALTFFLAYGGWRMGFMGGADVKVYTLVAALAPEVLLASIPVNGVLAVWNVTRGRGVGRVYVPGLVVLFASTLLALSAVVLRDLTFSANMGIMGLDGRSVWASLSFFHPFTLVPQITCWRRC